MSASKPSPIAVPEDPLQRLMQQLRAARDSASLAEGRALAQQAWRLAGERQQLAEQAEAGHLLCMFCFRTGALRELLDTGVLLLPLLKGQDQWQQRAEVLRWMTLAGCELGQYELAVRCGHENFNLAQQQADERSLSLAHTALGVCFERMGDPWQAERLLSDALRIARELKDDYLLLMTLNNLCAITIGAFYLLRGSDHADEASTALQRSLAYAREARSMLPRFEDPFYGVFVEGNLGEVLLHQGELAEARQLLENTMARGQQHGYAAQVLRIRCSMGELLLAEGQAQAACEAMTALLADMADTDNRATLVRIHHALYQAHRQRGHVEDALLHLEAYERLERRRANRQLRAQSEMLVTRLESEQAMLQVERARLEAQLARSLAAQSEAEAQRDQLTGLGNRRQLDRQLPGLLADAAANHQPLSLALLDLDHFKRVNDRFGHATGDKVLVALAELLRSSTRGADLLARLGGEEFLVLLPDTAPERAQEVCERVLTRVAQHDWDSLAPGLRVTLSIGLAHAPDYQVDSLFERADQALYRAKAEGRNRLASG